MTTDLPRLAIIGAGSMGGAILAGLVSPGVTVDGPIRVTNRTEAKARLLDRPGVESFALESAPDANLHAVHDAAIVLLGVKPAMIVGTLTALAPTLPPDALVISVAAGITTAAMEAVVPNPVLRAMPNTPAIIGMAVTGLAAGSRASAAHRALGRSLFETVGTVVEVPEAQLDALSTISGSGPAYVFYFAEKLMAAAVGMGFAPDEARTLVVDTFAGASTLLASSDRGPDELRRQVTSPNGTTERAIREFDSAELGATMVRATAAAAARAAELAAG